MRLLSHRFAPVAVGLFTVPVLAAALTGCSGSSPGASARTSTSPTPTATCPSVAPTPSPTGGALTKALQSVPFDLPMPSNITVVGLMTTGDGIHVLRFTTPSSLRDSVLFIVERYPKAGYTIGRGDAEATEADAPFVHGRVRGLARVAALEPCKTLWLLATSAGKTNGGTSPLLSPHPTSSVTSGLPFG